MDLMEDLQLNEHVPFKCKFEIYNFKESPVSLFAVHSLNHIFGGICSSVTLRVGVEGKWNKDYVVLYLSLSDASFWIRSAPLTVIFNCTLTILDVEGQQKFPRSLSFDSRLKYSGKFRARYVERSYILNNASEYLQEGTLTVIAEGTVEEWAKKFNPRSFPTRSRLLSIDTFNFHVTKLDHGLKVYILHDSNAARLLLEHSSVFRNMLNAPMREGKEKRILLRNEELPAFLCTLLFMETRVLVLYKVTITDVYKIAHMYDIPIVLEGCRNYMEKYMPKYALAVLEFTTYYSDTELKRTAESYTERLPGETQEHSENLETGSELDDDFVCDTLPVCSSLIKTEADLKGHLTHIQKGNLIELPFVTEEYMPGDPGAFDFYQ